MKVELAQSRSKAVEAGLGERPWHKEAQIRQFRDEKWQQVVVGEAWLRRESQGVDLSRDSRFQGFLRGTC